MNRIPYKEKNNRNSHKLPIKRSAKNNKPQKEIKINGFNIIELNEENTFAENEHDLNIFSEKEINMIKKKSIAIEEYYSSKSYIEKINENCFNCLMSNFSSNELLYFSKRKDLITYLKYCFYFLKKNLFFDHQTYIENRYDLDKCDINYLNGWRFSIPKTVCRGCFLQIINMKHLFVNLRNIFTDIDPNAAIKSVYRNRGHFHSRSRTNHSIRRSSNSKIHDINENRAQEKNKVVLSKNNKIQIKNIKYNTKKNQNISYDDKNGLISIKKDILGGEVGDLINKKEENEKKVKRHSKRSVLSLKEKINPQNDEQSVTEIKIKSNEFISEENVSEKNEIMKNENKKSKNNKDKYNNYYPTNDVGINCNKIKNNSLNDILINNIKNNKNNNINNNQNNNEYNSKEEKVNNNSNINKNNLNIYNEILNIKHISNRIVIKLYYRLNAFKDILIYTIINIGDFKEKLYNSMNFNPDIISYGINQYDQYFLTLYNEGFKARKEYEELFNKIKMESIPSISRNILILKEQEKLEDEEKKNLDEMEKNLKELSERINEIEQKYEESMNNFFGNFIYFFNLIKELKASFSGKIY